MGANQSPSVLGDHVRMVSLQFSFSNAEVIPSSVRRLERETPEERVVRKSRTDGVRFIEPVENVSLAQFLKDLAKAGYQLVDALCKPRIDANDPSGRRTYYMARFLFARREHATPSPEFKKVRPKIRKELQEICAAMWRVRAFLNPFYKDGEEITGLHAMSINLEVRKPLFDDAGQPLKARPRNAEGKRFGAPPLPLRPDYRLRIVDDEVKLEKESK